MPDIAAAYQDAKFMSDDALKKELASPTGLVPGYIIMAELQDRSGIRKNGSVDQPSMKDQLLAGTPPSYANTPGPPPGVAPSNMQPPPGGGPPVPNGQPPLGPADGSPPAPPDMSDPGLPPAGGASSGGYAQGGMIRQGMVGSLDPMYQQAQMMHGPRAAGQIAQIGQQDAQGLPSLQAPNAAQAPQAPQNLSAMQGQLRQPMQFHGGGLASLLR